MHLHFAFSALHFTGRLVLSYILVNGDFLKLIVIKKEKKTKSFRITLFDLHFGGNVKPILPTAKLLLCTVGLWLATQTLLNQNNKRIYVLFRDSSRTFPVSSVVKNDETLHILSPQKSVLCLLKSSVVH